MHDRSIIMRNGKGMAQDEDCQRTFFLLYWKGSEPGWIGPNAGRREAGGLCQRKRAAWKRAIMSAKAECAMEYGICCN